MIQLRDDQLLMLLFTEKGNGRVLIDATFEPLLIEKDAPMAQRATLDAMIPREDFALEGEEYVLDLFSGFPISNLAKDSPILRLLRKPDFQRETNHWNPDQVATFIASFLDNEVIPSLILWKSKSFIFVIDGGHRLSALRAWMDDDYGDGATSQQFYNGEISEEQKRIAKRTRKAIEQKVGRFSSLRDQVGGKGTSEQQKRANMLFTRALNVQWIQGSAAVAETSFFKINSQGTPLDDVEEMLIRNRRKAIAIGARAVLRAGAGHKYWSAFHIDQQETIERLAREFYSLVFEPEVKEPLKTLEVSLGGSVSPVNALALLIDFLAITGTRQSPIKPVEQLPEDLNGEATIDILEKSLEVVSLITGNSPGSLGLHPAVYFYNEKGKYSRFLFLGMSLLITEKVRNNDKTFFQKFTAQRAKLEGFLIENKSLIGILLQNMSGASRVPKMRDLFSYVITELDQGRPPTVEGMIPNLGLKGRIIDVVNAQSPQEFSDETKAMAFIRKALVQALTCPVCGGKLDPNKSVSYDHIKPRRDGGDGDVDNCDLVHPFCNTGVKN